ncbi:MAG: AI-2E family transporter [Clostridia bacterium]|nr:AI-2E family transporter [Clostridia bacterium]
MKNIYDSKSWLSTLRLLILIVITIIVYKFMDNADDVYINAGEKVGKIISSAKPFVFGAIIAYIFNPVVEFFDKIVISRIFFDKMKPKLRRAISTLCIYTILVYLIVSAMVYILPEVVTSVTDLFEELPEILDKGQQMLLEFNNNVYSGDADILTVKIADFINSIFETVENKATTITSTVIFSAISFTTNTIVVILSLIASAYFIISKDVWVEGSKKIVKGLFGKKAIVRYNIFWKKMNRTFIKYVLGKALASAILGIVCFVGLIVLKSPYTMLISVVFAATNMIPYFGPFIGEAVGGILVALIDPWLGLWVFLFLLLLQFVDALFLTPKMVGDSLKISPIWIMFSVILGGKLFGIPGMFFGAPITAVILDILNYRLNKKLILQNSTNKN